MEKTTGVIQKVEKTWRRTHRGHGTAKKNKRKIDHFLKTKKIVIVCDCQNIVPVQHLTCSKCGRLVDLASDMPRLWANLYFLDIERGDKISSILAEGLVYAIVNLNYFVNKKFYVTPDLTTCVSKWVKDNIKIDVRKGRPGEPLELWIQDSLGVWKKQETRSEKDTILDICKLISETSSGLGADVVCHGQDLETVIAASIRQGQLDLVKKSVKGVYNSQGIYNSHD